MNLLIVGGDDMGLQIATDLHQHHNITVIDDSENSGQSFETLDVQFVRGNGADPEDLAAAGAAEADALIACTQSDDVNVLSCLAGKGLGAKRTLAIVSRQRYLDAFAREGAMSQVGMSIDRVLWPQRILARQISNIVQIPRAVDSASFAGDRIHMREYRLEEGDPFLGTPLASLDVPKSSLIVGSIRGDSFIVPSGRTVLEPDDKVVFMGTRESMREVSQRFAPRQRTIRVTIIGGGNVGFMVAEQLQSPSAHITIIESNPERALKLAQLLPGALILEGDGTDLELMESERLDDSDVVVAVTNDDGKNLLASLLAKQVGIPKVVTRVGKARNRRLFERVGIDSPLTSRSAALQEVLTWLHVDEVDHLATIEDRAEIMEVEYPKAGTSGPIRELGAPQNSLIGAVLHKDHVEIPTGDTVLNPGDRLFIVTTPDNVSSVEAWLAHQCRETE